MPTKIAPSLEIPVAWSDMDAFGHVNNTIYLRWFESARIAFFTAIDVPQRDVEGSQGPILARTGCTFEWPLTYPDTVRATSAIERIGTKSFTMRYEVFSRQHGRRAAHGDGVVVWYDYRQGASSPLPEPLRARLAEYRVG